MDRLFTIRVTRTSLTLDLSQELADSAQLFSTNAFRLESQDADNHTRICSAQQA